MNTYIIDFGKATEEEAKRAGLTFVTYIPSEGANDVVLKFGKLDRAIEFINDMVSADCIRRFNGKALAYATEYVQKTDGEVVYFTHAIK